MSKITKGLSGEKRSKMILTIVFTVISIIYVLPVFFVALNSFKVNTFVKTDTFGWPSGESFAGWANFVKGMTFGNYPFMKSVMYSAAITIFSTALILLFTSMAAWYIARVNSLACKVVYFGCIFSMVIPFQVLMVPLVSVYGGTLGVLNHRLTLILLHVGFSVSMAMFMFHGAIKTNIPMELEEAATIDGCSRWQTWWKVVFPLLKPTIATVAIINAMAYWNDYLLPSLVLTKKELYTIPIATQAFYGTYSTDIGLVMAALLLAMLPILILYVFLQRYIVEGVTSGAVKG